MFGWNCNFSLKFFFGSQVLFRRRSTEVRLLSDSDAFRFAASWAMKMFVRCLTLGCCRRFGGASSLERSNLEVKTLKSYDLVRNCFFKKRLSNVWKALLVQNFQLRSPESSPSPSSYQEALSRRLLLLASQCLSTVCLVLRSSPNILSYLSCLRHCGHCVERLSIHLVKFSI